MAATDPTRMGWLRFGEASVSARFTVLALAWLGHAAFLWTLFGQGTHLLAAALTFGTCNILALAWTAFRRREAELGPVGLLGFVLGATMFLTLLLAVGLSYSRDDGLSAVTLFSVILGSLFAGAVLGLVGALVVLPLGLAIDRWRGDPVPRRGLDVWATLALLGAVASAVTALVGRAREPWSGGVLMAGARMLCDSAFPVAVLALSVWLSSVERGARRALAALPASPPAGYRWGEVVDLDRAAAPWWGLSDTAGWMALVRTPRAEVAYRGSAPEQVVAWWPAVEAPSWRVGAMMTATALGVAGVVLRVVLGG